MDIPTCPAPTGSIRRLFGVSWDSFTMLFVSIFAFLPLLFLLVGPKLVFFVGGWVGKYLLNRTDVRKEQILELVKKDEETWKKEHPTEAARRDSEEWEKLEGHNGGTSGVPAARDETFDGFVGFFHPFWYSSMTACSKETYANEGTVMLEEVGRECFGLRLEPRKRDIQRQNVLYTPAIMKQTKLLFWRGSRYVGRSQNCSAPANKVFNTESIQYPPSSAHGYVPVPHHTIMGSRFFMATIYFTWAILGLFDHGLGCILAADT